MENNSVSFLTDFFWAFILTDLGIIFVVAVIFLLCNNKNVAATLNPQSWSSLSLTSKYCGLANQAKQLVYLWPVCLFDSQSFWWKQWPKPHLSCNTSFTFIEGGFDATSHWRRLTPRLELDRLTIPVAPEQQDRAALKSSTASSILLGVNHGWRRNICPSLSCSPEDAPCLKEDGQKSWGPPD